MAKKDLTPVQGATFRFSGPYEPYTDFEAKVIGYDENTGIASVAILGDGHYERITIHLGDAGGWSVIDRVSGDHEETTGDIDASAKTAPPR